MISDKDEASLRQGLVEDLEHSFPRVVTVYTPIIRNHLQKLVGEVSDTHFVDADGCVQETIRRAKLLLSCLSQDDIIALDLTEWFCNKVEKTFKELFLISLVTQYQNKLFYHIARILNKDRDDDSVKDCVQEAFASAWQSLIGKSIVEMQNLYTENPRAWLYRIATTKAYNQLHQIHISYAREKQLGDEQVDDQEQGSFETPEDALGIKETHENIQLLLNTLPSNFEKPVHMHYLEGKEFPGIAKELGVPEGTAKGQVHQGLQKLRGYLIVKKALEEDEDVRGQVSILWDRHQSVVRFHFFDGLSLDQIAERQHWQLDKTKKYLYRGVEILLRHIESKKKGTQ